MCSHPLIHQATFIFVQSLTEGVHPEEDTCAPDGGGREGLLKDCNVRGRPDDLASTGVRSGTRLRSDISPAK